LKSVRFALITPSEVAFEGEAELVIAVTTEGEEGILPLHAPLLAALRPGILRANVRTETASERLERATGPGFIQALPDGVTVLVDEAVRFEDVDVAKTREELAAAIAAHDRSAEEFASAKLHLTGH
jgi:F-type H+-transporting ATPase subunit epsilon